MERARARQCGGAARTRGGLRGERTMTIHRRSVLKAMAALPGFAIPAFAQTYPDRPVKLIVPYLAGGATDIGARVVAERMAKGLGPPIVVHKPPRARGGRRRKAVG